ncbi:MAG: transporter substrate-binding domain-containing protein [Melioribacteraceae bacterium]|nr:transporter substrate-binding domain-containing protein [Melioribacteraceae bacterium]
MSKILKHIIPWLIAAISLLNISSCNTSHDKEVNPVDLDFSLIKERGKIIALTGYNAYSYFIYRGRPMGFEYDLVKRFADHLGVELEIKVVRNIDSMFEMLNSGKGDIIAFNLTVTKDRSKYVTFTHHHHTTRQVLVQRRPENWRQIKQHQIERKLIRNPLDLEGKTIHVRNGSAYLQRLQNLSEEIGGEINIVEADPDVSIEDLIKMVADGEIDYTISDDNIARLNQAHYTNIDIATHISFPQRIAWAVRQNAVELLDSINTWIDSMRKTSDYYVIYNKYYRNKDAYARRVRSDYFSNTTGKISEYDDIIKSYAEQVKWDWRIIASMIYQESQFKNTAKSWAGAKGLMQLMPETASIFGVEDLSDPRESLRAGVAYIGYLDKYWSAMVTDSLERIKFILASYNIGPGHILDARNLAEKYGADPNLWFGNVEKFLLNKSKERYFNDEIVKLGYARGTETVKYVREVLRRYEHYKKFIS